MREIGRNVFLVGLIAGMIPMAGCGGSMPSDLGVREGRLIPCPSSPNCVSSFETDEQHSIAALEIEGSASAAWTALVAELESREEVAIEQKEAGYVHAVFTSALMRYRDDVEFFLQAQTGRIAVRSASRVGYGDMDANRNRIESIRAALAAKGVVRSGA